MLASGSRRRTYGTYSEGSGDIMDQSKLLDCWHPKKKFGRMGDVHFLLDLSVAMSKFDVCESHDVKWLVTWAKKTTIWGLELAEGWFEDLHGHH